MQFIAERFDAKVGEKPVAGHAAGFNQVDESEPPRIGVHDPRTVFEVNNQMIMWPVTGMTSLLLVVKFPEIVSRTAWRPYGEPAGHTQMNEHNVSAVQFNENIFGASPERDDALARQGFGQTGGKRKPEIRPVQRNGFHTPVLKRRFKPSSYGFHFRQFRHLSSFRVIPKELIIMRHVHLVGAQLIAMIGKLVYGHRHYGRYRKNKTSG